MPARCFQLHEECGGPGTLSDVKGRKMVQRFKMNVGVLGLRTARTAKVPGNIPHVPS